MFGEKGFGYSLENCKENAVHNLRVSITLNTLCGCRGSI